jgi:phenylalanyl-tRNA synthetase beta chain
MPVLKFRKERVEEVLGLSVSEAVEYLERLKIEVSDVGDELELEVEVDRPDLYTLEGIARQLKGIMGKERGLPKYEVIDSGYKIIVNDVPVRPYVAGAVVWDVDVDEEFLTELIQFQEKLHASYGLGRRRIAIGLHDLRKVPSREIEYVLGDVDTIRFKPLHYSEVMTLREVLERTEQGVMYGHISLSGQKHPVLLSGGEVISAPPVINSDLTRIEPGTRHIFIDVTGTDEKAVLDVLAVIALNLAERSRSHRVGLVHLLRSSGAVKSVPDVDPHPMELSVDYVKRILGVELDGPKVVELLEAMRFGAKLSSRDSVSVLVPRYRVDVLHQVDLVEEVALALGTDALQPIRPSLLLRGRLLPRRVMERAVRELLIGHGFVELMLYSLVDCKEQKEVGGAPEEELIKIANPVSVDMDCMIYTTMPLLLRAVASNQHLGEVKVFTFARTFRASHEGERRSVARDVVGLVMARDKVGYEDIQAVVYNVLRVLGLKILSVKELKHPSLIEGRAAEIRADRVKAVIGEVHPKVLEKLGLDLPVAFAEIDYTDVSAGLQI